MDYDAKKAKLTPNSPEYQRVHRWIVKQLGKANSCSVDTTHTSSRYDWSNISREYKRDIRDWQQLCKRCHILFDGITQAGRESISEKNRVNSLGNTNATKIVECLDTGVSYRSIRDAARSLSILPTSINNCLRGKTKTAGKLRWQYGRV